MVNSFPGFSPIKAPATSEIEPNLGLEWVPFEEPSEKALVYQVPKGWAADGGMVRLSSVAATPWFRASAPDGAIEIFIGDPTLPSSFTVPKPFQNEGETAPSPSSEIIPPVVLTHRSGVEYARYQGPKTLEIAGYADVRFTGEKPAPEIANRAYLRSLEVVHGVKTRFAVVMPQHDAGVAFFSCRGNDTDKVAGIVADTTLPLANGAWFGQVAGFVATPNQQDRALAILTYMMLHLTWNAEWDAAMRASAAEALTRIYDEADAAAATMAKISSTYGQMIKNNMKQFSDTQKADHAALMNEMAQQSAVRTAKFKLRMGTLPVHFVYST